MSKPFHHFLPKVLLKGFCIEDSEAVWFCRHPKPKPKKFRQYQKPLEVKRRNINRIFGAEGLNSYQTLEGATNSDTEQFYAKKLENQWNPILEQARSVGNCRKFGSFSQQQKQVLAQVVYFSVRRSPDFALQAGLDLTDDEQFDEIVAHTIRDIQREFPFVKPEQLKFLTHPENRSKLIEQTRVIGTARPVEETIKKIAETNLVILRSRRAREGFIIGSNPVLRSTLGDSDGVNLPQRFSAYMPISNEVCLCFTTDSVRAHVLDLDRKQVRDINKGIASQSLAIAGPQKEIVKRCMKYIWPWTDKSIW